MSLRSMRNNIQRNYIFASMFCVITIFNQLEVDLFLTLLIFIDNFCNFFTQFFSFISVHI